MLEWSWASSILLDSGISILFPNYRGSIGYGEIFSHSLLGNISDMDVKDCMACLDYIKNVIKKGTPLRNALMGGSHGGFLTGHLIGQYPDVFEVASTRNPVFNLSTMVSLTDITDWTYIEAGIKFDYPDCLMRNLTVDELSTLYKKSPIYYINNVKTPLQILVGSKDLRAPMAQSIEYYKILKPRLQDKVRLLMYPDCQHSLNDNIDQEIDVWCNIWCWIYYWMRGENENQEKEIKSKQLVADIDNTEKEKTNKSDNIAKIDKLLDILDS